MNIGRKDVVKDLAFKIKETTNINFKKNIVTNLKMNISNFSDISGFTAKSTIEFITDIALKIQKKFGIFSTNQINTLVKFSLKSILVIDSKIENNSQLDFNSEKVSNINSNIEFLIGTSTTLGELDSLTLDDMDLSTLEELGFTQGVIFVMKKKLNIPYSVEINTTADFLVYYYYKLGDLDSMTLGDLDSMILGDIDRMIM